MPFSKARRSRRTDLSLSTSPHQPVETVQTPNPTSDTRMPVSPRLRYFIYRPLVSYLSRSKSYHILPASAVEMFSIGDPLLDRRVAYNPPGVEDALDRPLR